MACTITPTEKGFLVAFYNPKNKKTQTVGTLKTMEAALNRANRFDLRFYTNEKQYLPKNIYIREGLFVFQVTAELERRGKVTTRLGSARTLNDVKKIRDRIVLGLLQ